MATMQSFTLLRTDLMNLLLFHPHEETAKHRWALPANDRRTTHLNTIIKLAENQSVDAGVINGLMGKATLLKQEKNHWHFAFAPTILPPPPLPIILILALPRPKMLRRVLLDAITLGIKHIILINSYKVEKSYWQTPRLQPAQLDELIQLALEQAKDTQPPLIETKKRFKPFIEDELPALSAGKSGYLLHPSGSTYLPTHKENKESIIAIGPEGGWTEYEALRFGNAGFTQHSLGQRILRVETALPTIVGRYAKLP